jgi:cytochrome c biogenesis protein CcmG/thiol:disulfide interchange protein DsbE
MSNKNSVEQNQVTPNTEVVNPHSLWKQVTGVVIASLVVLALYRFSGVLVALLGIFTFLDAWNSGIFKKSDTKSFVNISPMGWSICMMGLFIVTYPVYLVKRNTLKTKDGPPVYWILVNVFAVIALLVVIAPLMMRAGRSGGGTTMSWPSDKPAPSFTLQDLDGKQVSLSDFKGKVVILDFWATWCPPCTKEIPHFIKLYEQYKDRGFAMVGISLDNKGVSVVKSFAQKNRINYPILMADGQVQTAYGGITSIPTTFVIDAEGSMRRKYIGYRDKAVFEADIKTLLAGMELEARPLRVATTDHIIVDDFESYNDLDPTDPARQTVLSSVMMFLLLLSRVSCTVVSRRCRSFMPTPAAQHIQRPNAPLLFRRIGLKPALRHSCCTSTAPRGTLGSCI